MPIINLALRQKYLTRAGNVVEINKQIATNDSRYTEGFRFLDKRGNPYTEDGRTDVTSDLEHQNDIVELFNPAAEPIEVVDRSVVETELPGYFTLLGERLRRNPIKTSVGAAVVVGAAGYGAYNYRDHGTVLPRRNRRAGEVARAAALVGGAFVRLLG